MPYKSRASAYPTLEAEIARRQIKKKDIAEAIGIKQRTLSLKLMGNTDFTLTEAFIIRQKYFSDMTFEELFKKSDDNIVILNSKLNNIKPEHRQQLIDVAKEIFEESNW